MTKKNFCNALKQIDVESKIKKYESISLLEENWNFVEDDKKVSEKEIDDLLLKQIDVLLNKGGMDIME